MGSNARDVHSPSARKRKREEYEREEDMGLSNQSLDPPNTLKPDASPKKPEGKEHEEEESYCCQLDDNTWLLYTLDDIVLTLGGRLKQMDKDGKVKYFPLRGGQMDWIYQRAELPSGSFNDWYPTADVSYPRY